MSLLNASREVTNMSLEESIIDYVRQHPGCKAKDIAHSLGKEKTQINSLLYGNLQDVCYSNKDYGWFVKNGDDKGVPITGQNEPDIDKSLSDLCHYYLSCINLENVNGVSAFLTSKYSLQYAEIPELSVHAAPPEAQSLLNTAANAKDLSCYIGYPVSIYNIHSKNGTFTKIAPLFLFSIEFSKNGNGPSIHSVPVINSEAIKQYTTLDQNEQTSEILKLYEDLGLNNPEADVDIDDICARLMAIRNWPWKDEIATTQINTEKPVSSITVPGVYNRAIIIAAERSPYTVGLENELSQLALLPEQAYQGTALYSFIHPEKEKQQTERDGDTVLEVLPLNTEQRNAIRASENKKVMVVTGPPGTGKSQVVTDLIVNSAWKGKSVLFSSKNNKAVDVVEVRANGLAKQPVVLRLGGTQFATALAQAIENLFAKGYDENSVDEYKYQEKLYKEKQKILLDIESAKKAFVDARNQLDRIEQEICSYSDVVRTKWYPIADDTFTEQYIHSFDRCSSCYDHAVYQKQSLVRRILWPLYRRKATEQTAPYVIELNEKLKKLGITELPVPQGNKNDCSFNEINGRVADSLKIIKKLTEYKNTLRAFVGRKQLSEYDRELCEVTEQLSRIATNVWRKWLETRNITLSADEKKVLFDFTTAMKLNDDVDIQQGSELSKAFFKAQKTMTRMIPCWAVTSLSVKSRVPFQAGLFDYVIIDEASQCDIASALPLLYRAKQAVIIGDEKQLHHISTLAKKQDLQLIEKNNVGLSWSYSVNSLFNYANALTQYPFADKVALRDHFRCCSEIINYSNNEFYGGMLRVATNYQYLKTPNGQKPGIRWTNVKGTSQRPSTGSLVNEAEAKAIITELKRLVIDDGYVGSIGVVAPFRAQAELISKLVESNADLQKALRPYHELLIDTVHKFQGDERDCMFFSVTAAHGVNNGAISFLQGNGNLFNVAVTRARAVLVVVGDYKWASTCSVSYLKDFALYAGHIETDNQLEAIGITNNAYTRDYPHVLNPEQVSDWEKLLYTVLFDAGIHTIPQYPEDKYKLDLALIVNNRKLDIEVDGELYHKDWNGELCYRDKLRNQRMYELGWDVKRFWVYQIRDELPRCISEIRKWIALES